MATKTSGSKLKHPVAAAIKNSGEHEAARTVVTIGGAMIDTIALISNDLIERMVMNNAGQAFLLIEEGRKTEADLISTHPGGGAINSAVCFARLGFAVDTLVKLGCDDRAESIMKSLAAEGISGRLVVHTAESHTGASVLISAHERDAAIFTFRGANSLLTSSDLPKEGFAQHIVYITGLSDSSADVFPELVELASSHDAFVVANPGIRQITARGDAFQKALAQITLLSMNREEAAALMPRLVRQPERHTPTVLRKLPEDKRQDMILMRRGLVSGGFEMSLPQFFDAVLGLGPQCIIVTDGTRGAYVAVADEMAFCPSFETKAVGTAGAGDAFTSTFAAFYANGEPPSEALRYASLNASSVVGFADTQSGLLSHAALTEACALHGAKLNVWNSRDA